MVKLYFSLFRPFIKRDLEIGIINYHGLVKQIPMVILLRVI